MRPGRCALENRTQSKEKLTTTVRGLGQRKREQVSKIRPERGVTIDSSDIQGIIRGSFENFCILPNWEV